MNPSNCFIGVGEKADKEGVTVTLVGVTERGIKSMDWTCRGEGSESYPTRGRRSLGKDWC